MNTKCSAAMISNPPRKSPRRSIVVPPGMKTYRITRTRGNFIGERIVRELLDAETESAKVLHGREIGRPNYDFVFLRQENFGLAPEYVLRIVPKRKDKFSLRGQIWVDATTFRIRRIEGVPAKNPSFWIRTLISLCNMRNWEVCGYLFRLTLALQCVS